MRNEWSEQMSAHSLDSDSTVLTAFSTHSERSIHAPEIRKIFGPERDQAIGSEGRIGLGRQESVSDLSGIVGY
jgi:hypothetical protein